MTERLLLVQEQLPSPFNYSGDAKISLPPCLSESKHSHLAYFTYASFSSPFFVLTLIRLDLFHQALLRPSMHMSIPRSAERGHIKATTMLPSPNTALSTSYLVCSTQSLLLLHSSLFVPAAPSSILSSPNLYETGTVSPRRVMCLLILD